MEERRRERHGMSRTPTYHVWATLKQRCFNENHSAHDRYGGRGIGVCERWQDSFVAFLEDMGQKPDGMSLDRIDNDKGYSLDNCRWATPKQQMNNTSRTRYVTIDGQRQLASVVAAENGVSSMALSQRVKSGWSIEQAVGLVEHYVDSAITIDGKTLTMAQWAKKLGISRQAVFLRIKQGWSVEKALTAPKTDFVLRRGVPVGPRGPMVKERKDGIGKFITEQRRVLHLTQKQLAARIGVRNSTISSIETGKVFPSPTIAARLADALEVRIDDIAPFFEQNGIAMNQYECYTALQKGGEPMNIDERITWLQVRMSDEEKMLLTSLSVEYGVSLSAFVRMMISYFDEKRPTVSVRFSPKSNTPDSGVAQEAKELAQ